MNDEHRSLELNQAWDIVPKLESNSMIGSTWVYTIKGISNGTHDKDKAHLVAQRFKKEYNINYDETMLRSQTWLQFEHLEHFWPLLFPTNGPSIRWM